MVELKLTFVVFVVKIISQGHIHFGLPNMIFFFVYLIYMYGYFAWLYIRVPHRAS